MFIFLLLIKARKTDRSYVICRLTVQSSAPAVEVIDFTKTENKPPPAADEGEGLRRSGRTRTKSPSKYNGFITNTSATALNNGLVNHLHSDVKKEEDDSDTKCGLVNGLFKPMTRTAKIQQEQHKYNQSHDLKREPAFEQQSTSSDLINSKAIKTKVETLDITTKLPDSSRDTQMTDFFPIRRSERKPKATLMYERQMDIEKKILSGSEEGLTVSIIVTLTCIFNYFVRRISDLMVTTH